MRILFVAFVFTLLTPFAFGETSVTVNSSTTRTSTSSVTVNNNTVVNTGTIVSGNVLVGSGNIASENRDLADVETIRLEVGANVTVVKGEKAKCVITADDNILPVILMESAGKVLRIFARESYSTRQNVDIAIEVPHLKKAEITGSGSVTITDVLTDKAYLVISGSGDIAAIGKVKELMATISGSGNLNAADLEANRATVVINGSGDADVHATAFLTAQVNGSGDITYVGTPSKVEASVNGSGQISRK